MITADNSLDIMAALDSALGIEDEATDPNELTDYDLDDALSEVERQMDSRAPIFDIFLALAWDGYGQEDQIWDAIFSAARDALREYVEDRWQEQLAEEDSEEDAE